MTSGPVGTTGNGSDNAGTPLPCGSGAGAGFRSGFVAVVGRTGVGKSTLVNAMVGRKVSITSRRPGTTRMPVQGVLNGRGFQAVLVDTPGFHKPRNILGERQNAAAAGSISSVDVVLVVVDASREIGAGDRFAASAVREAVASFAVVNKIDRVARRRLPAKLLAASALPLGSADAVVGSLECFPVSSRSGEGIGTLVDALASLLPEGPKYYPDGIVSDLSEVSWTAEMVREQVLARVGDELPQSVACRIVEWEWPRVRCEVLVERESQKPIVIGAGGRRLKAVGEAVREQLAPGAYLELVVKVERNWPKRPDILSRLGY